jgi:hypothetical protein
MFAALTASRWIEDQTGWPVRKLVRTARRYQTIQNQADNHTITAADPCPATSAKPSITSTAIRCALRWPNSGQLRAGRHACAARDLTRLMTCDLAGSCP